MIELLHHPIAPWLRLGDEPQLDPVLEAQPDERPQPAWMRGAAVEDHFVIHLEMPRHPEPTPNHPKGLIDRGPAPTEQGLRATAAGAQINNVQTVEPERAVLTSEMSRADEISLVPRIGRLCREIWILGSFGFIAPRPSVGEGMTGQDAIDGP